MSMVESNIQMNVKTQNGDILKLYPNTKIDNIDGLQTSLDSKVSSIKIGTSSAKYEPNADGVVTLPAYPTDTNTHRPIKVNGTQILGDDTTALNLQAGSNIALTNENGTVTIAATTTVNTTIVNIGTSYTNIESIVVPAKGRFRVCAAVSKLNSRPTGILLSTSQSDPTTNIFAKNETNEEIEQLSVNTILLNAGSSDLTYYIWAKVFTQTNNRLTLIIDTLRSM